MSRTSSWVRGTTVALAAVLTLFSLGFSWGVVDDYARREVLPVGAHVDGVPVGGLSRADALALVHRKVEEPLLTRLDLRAGKRKVTLEPGRMVSIDVTGMVDAAFTPERRLPLTERLYRRVSNQPLKIAVERRMRIDQAVLKRWVDTTARKVHISPVDATVKANGDAIRITKSRPGQDLDRKRAIVMLGTALAVSERESALPVTALKPKVTEKAFARVLLVNLSERRLTLFHTERKVKSYSIAVGQDAYPTPTGDFFVEGKEMWPTWTNPGSGWAAGMPQSIPPGPGNPLGSRAIAIDSPGVRIHGTSNDGSIGTAASHGCMRMHMWDVEDLYPRVQVGDRVIIQR